MELIQSRMDTNGRGQTGSPGWVQSLAWPGPLYQLLHFDVRPVAMRYALSPTNYGHSDLFAGTVSALTVMIPWVGKQPNEDLGMYALSPHSFELFLRIVEETIGCAYSGPSSNWVRLCNSEPRD